VIAANPYTIGSIVRARGREWVVVPGDSDDTGIVYIRPLGGGDEDVTGLLPAIEHIESATFPLPDPTDFGDHLSAKLLRDAVRLNVRAGAGPFRSFGRIAVEPRSYQLMPLLMALRLDPVRLLIADDVGIGKTIEAGLIARELLDRGEIRRIAVICPAHLCEQWQEELHSKFDIMAEVVRPGTVRRLERPLRPDQSVFEAYPFVVVSIDYVKIERRRHEFLRACPEFVVVDEAHTCAMSSRIGSSQQQRHRLLQELVNGNHPAAQQRHLILTTATPHSGNEDAFRSLLSLLDPAFAHLPEDHELTANHPLRQRLARHLIQRRRPDITEFLGEDTPFPKRRTRESTWTQTRDGQAFFDAVLAYARSLVDRSSGLARQQQRVSWWAALALLRSAISSPASAVAALQTKASGITQGEHGVQISDDEAGIDEQGERTVFDVDLEDSGEFDDQVPGADTTDLGAAESERRKLRELVKAAEALMGKKDPKLEALAADLADLLAQGFRPIVFCRYIATAEYLAAHLGQRFRETEVYAVTGMLPPEERKQRVADLAAFSSRILVATDCLSEGINLQEHFDAVIHYDLAWNPTRHEQREGRVDRFGQAKPEVRTVMLYGADNPVDQSVMDVLLRKAETIRARLGIAVSVPQRSSAIMDSVFEAIFHGRGRARQLTLGMSLEADRKRDEQVAALDAEWDAIERRERAWHEVNAARSNTIFRQSRIHPEQVKQELDEVRAALGSPAVVSDFVRSMAGKLGYPLVERNGTTRLPLNGMPARLTAAFPDRTRNDAVPVSFTFPVPDGVYHLSRTSDAVEALATLAIDGALDPNLSVRPARRSTAIRTAAVAIETSLAVARLRVYLRTAGRTGRREMLAEESMLVAWRWGNGDSIEPLTNAEISSLLEATPASSVSDQFRQRTVERVLADEPIWRQLLDAQATARAREVLEAHRRVRDVASISGAGQLQAEAMLPVDLIGLYVYLPA